LQAIEKFIGRKVPLDPDQPRPAPAREENAGSESRKPRKFNRRRPAGGQSNSGGTSRRGSSGSSGSRGAGGGASSQAGRRRRQRRVKTVR
jgi:hypothetical protein